MKYIQLPNTLRNRPHVHTRKHQGLCTTILPICVCMPVRVESRNLPIDVLEFFVAHVGLRVENGCRLYSRVFPWNLQNWFHITSTGGFERKSYGMRSADVMPLLHKRTTTIAVCSRFVLFQTAPSFCEPASAPNAHCLFALTHA